MSSLLLAVAVPAEVVTQHLYFPSIDNWKPLAGVINTELLEKEMSNPLLIASSDVNNSLLKYQVMLSGKGSGFPDTNTLSIKVPASFSDFVLSSLSIITVGLPLICTERK